MSAMAALPFAFGLVVSQGQLMGLSISAEERLSMTVEEKAFRFRQKFTTEVGLYSLVLSLSCVLALNHVMSVNRKQQEFEDKIKAHLGKPKKPQDKKND